MIPLLIRSKYDSLANTLTKLESYLDDDLEEAIYKIHSLFGGMGSLNDVVLQEDGMPLTQGNIEFNNLSNELYELSTRQ